MDKMGYRLLANEDRPRIARVLQTLASKECALKASELAKLLGVTRQQIYKLAAAKSIPSFRIGTSVRFDPNDVAEWLERKMPQRVILTAQKIAV